MIKRLIIFAIFILSSSTIFASDVLIEARKYEDTKDKSREYFNKKKLLEVYNNNFLVEDYSKSYTAMITKISEELTQRSLKAPGSVNQDTCSSLCVSYGTSEMRLKLFFQVSYKIDLSKETRECQNVCKVYFAGYYGYYDGLKEANSLNENSDCSGSVSSGSRSSKPLINISPGDLEKGAKSKTR